MRGFCKHVISDIDDMEQKLIDALQRDTIAIIDRSEIEPIKVRLNKLEASSLSPSRNNIQVEPDSSN